VFWSIQKIRICIQPDNGSRCLKDVENGKDQVEEKDVPTLRILVGHLQGRRGLLRSLPRHLRAASCAAARGGEGGTISIRRGGNQASRGGCSTDGMPRRSAVACNLLVRLGQRYLSRKKKSVQPGCIEVYCSILDRHIP